MKNLKRNNRWKLSAPLLSILFMLSVSLVLAPASNASEHTSELETASATVETLSREFRLDGVVEAVNRATVSAQTRGSIQEILVDVDDYVEKGDVIIRLKDTSQQAQLKKAKAGDYVCAIRWAGSAFHSGAYTPNGRRWCDSQCRDDWERAQTKG